MVPRWSHRAGSPELVLEFPVSPREAIAGLAAHASHPSAAHEALTALAAWETAPAILHLDLDEAIAMGEAELAGPGRATSDGFWNRWIRYDLAALLHRRACLRAGKGALDAAIEDLRRACALDEHPEHRTTLALFHERRGDTTNARAAHDEAVAAIATVAPPADHDGYDVNRDEKGPREHDHDVRESWPRRAARTLECRGAFRAARGDLAGARADLEASLAMCDTASARRRLASLAPSP